MPKLREIMTTEVETGEPDTTLEEIAAMMRDGDVGAIPIVEDDELVGIVTDRDIVVRCIAEGKDPAETTVEDVLSEDLETATPDMDVEEAARIMSRRQIRRLPVVEENRLIGIVSLGDIAVKHDDEEVGGQALEDISEGVKQGGGNRGRRERTRRGVTPSAGGLRVSQEARTGNRGQMPSARGRQQGSVRGRDEATVGSKRPSRNEPSSRQGITSRAASAERARQEKVSPSRATRPASRRRAS